MNTILYSVVIDGIIYKKGDKLISKEKTNSLIKGETYILEHIKNKDKENFFYVKRENRYDTLGGYYTWRFEKYKKNNKGAY